MQIERTKHGVGNGPELHQPPITHSFDNVAAMIADQRIKNIFAKLTKLFQRLVLISLHLAGVINYVSGKNGR